MPQPGNDKVVSRIIDWASQARLVFGATFPIIPQPQNAICVSLTPIPRSQLHHYCKRYIKLILRPASQILVVYWGLLTHIYKQCDSDTLSLSRRARRSSCPAPRRTATPRTRTLADPEHSSPSRSSWAARPGRPSSPWSWRTGRSRTCRCRRLDAPRSSVAPARRAGRSCRPDCVCRD